MGKITAQQGWNYILSTIYIDYNIPNVLRILCMFLFWLICAEAFFWLCCDRRRWMCSE